MICLECLRSHVQLLMSKDRVSAALCFRKQQLISPAHTRHMGLCLAPHLIAALVCDTSYFILIMAGYPWQLCCQRESCFLKGKKGKKNNKKRRWAGYEDVHFKVFFPPISPLFPGWLHCNQRRVWDPWGVNYYLSALQAPCHP